MVAADSYTYAIHPEYLKLQSAVTTTLISTAAMLIPMLRLPTIPRTLSQKWLLILYSAQEHVTASYAWLDTLQGEDNAMHIE